MNTKPNTAKLLERYLNNQCTDDELAEIISLFQNENYREQLQSLLSNYWDGQAPFRQSISQNELDQMLDSLHHRINTEQPAAKGKITRLYQFAMRAAAVLFIPLLLFSVWTLSNRNNTGADNFITLETPLGSKLKTSLPDGTEVWQNGGSTLKYPARFNSKQREVTLVGEAYFHVKSDKKHPFLVKTAEGTVTVTGTRFNVSSYPDDANYSVVLEEGHVSFQAQNSDATVELKPSEQVLLNKQTGKLEKMTIDTEKYTSWTSGKLIFRNDALDNVVARLNRWYNADVKIIDPNHELDDYTFTMTVKQETIEQVLQYITQASRLKLKREEVNANGLVLKTRYEISK